MRKLRSLVASGLCIVAAVCMRSWGGNPAWQLWIPTGLLALAGLLSLAPGGPRGLLARAILWSNLLLAVVVAHVGHGHERLVAAVLGGATGLALVALGRQGLDDDGGAFAPVAYRATLTALLVMALADAQTLLFWGSVFVDSPAPFQDGGVLTLAIAAAFAAGVVGMYRLRTWGLFVDSLAAGALLVAVAAGAYRELELFQLLFAGSALLQLALAAPLYRALVRGAHKAPRISHASVWASLLLIVALTLLSVAPAIAAI